ncbi:MAG: DUF1553 domain-containing protein [Verrucomicrobia bacterium]|nr:DUF1553 domain-containing protein [Verrucomicrobiota bacterium]
MKRKEHLPAALALSARGASYLDLNSQNGSKGVRRWAWSTRPVGRCCCAAVSTEDRLRGNAALPGSWEAFAFAGLRGPSRFPILRLRACFVLQWRNWLARCEEIFVGRENAQKGTKAGISLRLLRLFAAIPRLRLRRAVGFVLLHSLISILPAHAGQTSEPAKANQNNGWSFRPVQRPAVPAFHGADLKWIRNPIDAFILTKLHEKSLAPSPEADRRTLIRRLYFDLIGLPPTPEQIDVFLADSNPKAYENLVDRLLASPHYGERWARHWLDVVHYGETHGYDKDKPRPNAWPYRDYVIRAFNADKPYARFVQEQIAGDVLAPDTEDGIEATGFIAAGPWDLIGHMEVPEDKIDGKIARHLDRDDMVANAMGTFVSLTVHCAQCHDHKFDPIAQEDYYSLQSVFAALDRADRKYYSDPSLTRQRSNLEARQRALAEQKKTLEEKIAKLGGSELADLEKKIEAARKASSGAARPEFGYHSQIEATPDQIKWVQVDLGRPVVIDKVIYVGCHDDFNNIGEGFGFPVRFKIEISDDAEFSAGAVRIVDHTQADFTNPGVDPQTAIVHGKSARYVRVTATKLAPRKDDYIFALGELSVLDSDGKNAALGARVTALDAIEAPVRWQTKNLVDGYTYTKAKANPEALAKLQTERQALLDRAMDADTKKELSEVTTLLAQVDAEISRLPKPNLAFVGTVHYGSGAFRGTGPEGGRPRPIHVLNRGDVKNPGPEARPGALKSVAALPARFDLPPEHAEGARRLALAQWITDPGNPFTWRSIVNRVWLYHFGRGLVDTPDDFGRMGQMPTHPELLDWLALEFRDHGQSLKQLHRLLVTSATYRQVSAANESHAKTDANNAYYWRMNRRRLEAEALRDSVLFVSGKLDPKLYGPSFQDFVIEKPEHSPHYQYHLHDPEDPRSHRRSIYRFIVRSQQQPFMTTLDCADPSMRVDKRNETLSALQALALLNDAFMLTMAKHFAARVEKAGGELADKVESAFRLAIGRRPSAPERTELAHYAKQHGLANTCRVILNLNEFLFVD